MTDSYVDLGYRHLVLGPVAYHVEIATSAIYGGLTLHAVRRDGPAFGQLSGMTWEAMQEGDAPSYTLTSGDTGGDLAGFVQAFMDGAWRAGFRPTSFCADAEIQQAVIRAVDHHNDSLRKQVKAQQTIINKLLSKT